MTVNIEDFNKQTECVYKEELYSARDNGSVLRHPCIDNRIRQTDNKWTFGKPNNKTGYMEIASISIHRIIAFAFHGEPPTKQHVVDHIDTNKRNNRPENLRWVTRLENVLLNPITVKRIEISCKCSIEEFLADPSKFRNKFQEPNYEWMCTVSAEEGQISLQRMKTWAKSDKLPSGGSLGEWIFNRSLQNEYIEEIPKFEPSLTLNAVQQNWQTPSEFPCCPQEGINNSIHSYFANLMIGKVFAKNQYSNSIIVNFAISIEKNVLWVMCKNSNENAIKPYSLAEVSYEKLLYIHTSLGSFFNKDGAEKEFILSQGLEWTGGDTFDDFV